MSKIAPSYLNESGLLSFRKMAEASSKDENFDPNTIYEGNESNSNSVESQPQIEKVSEPAPTASAPETNAPTSPEPSDSATLAASTEVSKPGADIEIAYVRGPNGKKTKLEIDYSNRESVKRAFLQAAGMRKFQAERDEALKKEAELNKSLSEKATHYDDLEQVWAQGGVKALVTRLGKDGEEQFKGAIEAEIKRREYLSGLTPEEKGRLEMKEREEYANKRASEVEAKYAKMLEDISAKDVETAKNEFAAKLTPSFDRYRFAGKLNDPSLERFYDKSIWNEAREILDSYPDEMERTPALIDKTFRSIAQKIRVTQKDHVETQVQKVIDKKATEAMNTIQVTAQKGLTSQDLNQSAFHLAAKGKLRDAMSLIRSGK